MLKYISTNLFELCISAAGRIMSIGFMFDSELPAREIADSSRKSPSCKYHLRQDSALQRVRRLFVNTRKIEVENLPKKAEVKSHLSWLQL